MTPAPRKVGLIGSGPLPSSTTRQLGFPQLRVDAFRTALLRAGHQVETVLLEPGRGAARTGPARVTTFGVEASGWRAAAADLLAKADVLVGAGPFRPGEVAVTLAGERPVLVDLPGDPLAELQAWAIAHGRAPEPARLAAALDVLGKVLARADAISVVSAPQRLAVFGQLGLTGRLAVPHPAGVAVVIVPVALPAGPPPRSPTGPPNIVVAGGLNPWFDLETALAAAERVLQLRPDLHLTWLGGPIPGLATPGWEQVQALASRWSGRVVLPGWLEEAALHQAIDGAEAGLCFDRPGLEPTFGSRTRLLLYAARGVLPVATATCALARDMAGAGLLRAVPVGDTDAAVAALLLPPPDSPTRQRLRGFVLDHHSVDATTAALLAWVAAPLRAPRTAADVDAALSGEVERLRAELSAVHGSTTWRWMDRLNRGLFHRR